MSQMPLDFATTRWRLLSLYNYHYTAISAWLTWRFGNVCAGPDWSNSWFGVNLPTTNGKALARSLPISWAVQIGAVA